MAGAPEWAARAVVAVLVTAAGATGGMAADPRPLQPLIDAAEPRAVIALDPGTYAGPVEIDKPLTLDGGDAATIDGGGKGTVIRIAADGVEVRNLRIVNSGSSHNDIDAGVHVEGNFNVVKDNVIEDTLFGVDLQQADNNIVRRNRIRSKDAELGARGDAIRLWYSAHNRIEHNDVARSRDMVVWYSGDNTFAHNTVRGGRYGLHFMYAQKNVVRDNTFIGNSVGSFLMYSDGIEVRRNHYSHGLGATGMGVGLKETSDVVIEDNVITYCATGLYLDVSPFQPDTTNRIERNRLAFNGIGVLFHNDWTGNVLRDNRFENNLAQVSVNALASAARNDWTGNYWDDYRGFDRDRDGIGDSPHTLKVYADRVWMDVPYAALFRGSPVLSLVDFLERLAPFSEPIVLLRDDAPRMAPAFAAARHEAPAGGDGDGKGGRLDPFGLNERLKEKERIR